jgi:hypothetical protein
VEEPMTTGTFLVGLPKQNILSIKLLHRNTTKSYPQAGLGVILSMVYNVN